MSPVAFDSKNELVCHAMLRIGDSNLLLADAWPNSPEQGPKGFASAGMWLYVKDSDSVFEQAHKAGLRSYYAVDGCFLGLDQAGKVRDPFGHTWAIATHKFVASQDEIQKGMKEWEHSMHHSGCC